jgi:SAM-dependent methyltransferase
VGCGTGNITSLISKIIPFTVGVDISYAMVREAKARIPCADFIVCDADFLPFQDATFDLVTMYSVLHHLPKPFLSLRECSRVCQSLGGCFIDHEPRATTKRKLSDIISWTLSNLIKLLIKKWHIYIGNDKRMHFFEERNLWIQVPESQLKDALEPYICGFDFRELKSKMSKMGFDSFAFSYEFFQAAIFSELPYFLDWLSVIDDLLSTFPGIKYLAPMFSLFATKGNSNSVAT